MNMARSSRVCKLQCKICEPSLISKRIAFFYFFRTLHIFFSYHFSCQLEDDNTEIMEQTQASTSTDMSPVPTVLMNTATAVAYLDDIPDDHLLNDAELQDLSVTFREETPLNTSRIEEKIKIYEPSVPSDVSTGCYELIHSSFLKILLDTNTNLHN